MHINTVLLPYNLKYVANAYYIGRGSTSSVLPPELLNYCILTRETPIKQIIYCISSHHTIKDTHKNNTCVKINIILKQKHISYKNHQWKPRESLDKIKIAPRKAGNKLSNR